MLRLKVVRIGNSRGIRLPARLLSRAGIGDELVAEERQEGILLRGVGSPVAKLSWEATAREMARRQRTRPGGPEHGRWLGTDSVAATSGPRRRAAITLPCAQAPQKVKHYEVRWVQLDPVTGGEMAKTRPAVIVSLDQLNAVLQTVTICPITSQLHPAWRTRLPIQVGGHPAEIAGDQIRTVAKTRARPEAWRADHGETACCGACSPTYTENREGIGTPEDRGLCLPGSP